MTCTTCDDARLVPTDPSGPTGGEPVPCGACSVCAKCEAAPPVVVDDDEGIRFVLVEDGSILREGDLDGDDRPECVAGAVLLSEMGALCEDCLDEGTRGVGVASVASNEAERVAS